MRAPTLQAIASCDKGSISVLTAFFFTTMISLSALTVDVGSAFLKKRELQAATDAAAMAAAQNPSNATAIATQLLSENGFSNAHIVALTTGQYYTSSSIPVNARYVAGASPANAVSLTTSMNTPISLAQSLVQQKNFTVTSSSKAMELNEAGLVAGSGLINVNNGLANTILGGLLGSNVSLTALQYQGLLNANVNAIDFLNGLATTLNITAGTYGQLLTSTVNVASVLSAQISALQQEGSLNSDQLNALQGLQSLKAGITGSPSINLSTLLDAGIWQDATVGSLDHKAALQANLNLYQLTTFTAQIANGSNLVAANNAISIPGVANFNVAMTGLEPAQGSYFALGPTGTTVHTAQVRLLLTANLLSALSIIGLPSSPISLPIYIEVANGTASISSISCNTAPATDTTVSVSAQSGVGNAYIGSVSTNAMKDFTQPVTVGLATIVNAAPLFQVTGSAQAAVQGNTNNLVFNETQIQNLTPQTVTSTNMFSNLLGNMATTLALNANILGFIPVSASLIVTAVRPILQPVFTSLDSIVDQVLRVMGVRVGYLDVTVNGARCGISNLVQ